MRTSKEIFISLLSLLLVSCDKESFVDTGKDDREVTVAVSLGDRHMMSRASIGTNDVDKENYIVRGEYGFIAPRLAGSGYDVHRCCFFDNRHGNIYFVTDGTPSSDPLKWSDKKLEGIDKFIFRLDNLGYETTCTYTALNGKEFLVPNWSEEEKTTTYAAQREEYNPATGEATHTNDIIWGVDTVKRDNKGKERYVELTHRMSRINVALVNLTESQRGNIKEITISNLVLKPESFNRLDGTVSVASSPDRKYLTLFDKEKGDNLQTTTENSGSDTYEEYMTCNYILPPQPLDENNWPVLTVTYTDDNGSNKIVKGLIPHEVINENGNSWESLDRLNAADHLTVVAEIKGSIPDIIFTARVRPWIELGPVVLDANYHKPGIYNLEDLNEFIDLYNKQNENPATIYDFTYELSRFADCDLSEFPTRLKWKLILQSNIDILDTDLARKLKRSLYYGIYPVTIDDNGYNLTLNNKTGISAILAPSTGINNKTDLENCIKLYNSLPQFNSVDWNPSTFEQKRAGMDKLLEYGTCETVGNVMKWTFDLNYPITELPTTKFRHTLCRFTEYGDFTPWMYPLSFNNNAGSNESVIKQLEGNKGIYVIEDLVYMIRAFNEHRTNFMEFYGTINQSELSYTFTLMDNISGDIPQKMKRYWEGVGNVNVILNNPYNFTINDSSGVNNLIE